MHAAEPNDRLSVFLLWDPVGAARRARTVRQVPYTAHNCGKVTIQFDVSGGSP